MNVDINNFNDPNRLNNNDVNNSNNLGDNKLACLFHLLYFINFIIPFSGLIALIVIRACRENLSNYSLAQWREAMNFQISMMVYGLLFTVLIIIIIGIPLLGLLFLFSLIMPIMASIKTLDGQQYRYPLIFRWI